MNIKHIVDFDSPRSIIWLHSPCYRTPQEREQQKNSPFYMTDAELTAMWGQHWKQPYYPEALPSLAYCGEQLDRTPRPAPKFLYECNNFTLVCSLPSYKPDELCWDCIRELDKQREKLGKCGIFKRFALEAKSDNFCDCSDTVLVRSGCKCK